MLRLLHRDPSSKKEQAHVYVPGKNTIVKENENPLPSTSFTKFISNKILDPINSIKAELSNQKTNNDFCKDQGNVVPVTQNKCNQKTNSNCGKINTAEMKEKLKEMRDESKHSLPDVVFVSYFCLKKYISAFYLNITTIINIYILSGVLFSLF